MSMFYGSRAKSQVKNIKESIIHIALQNNYFCKDIEISVLQQVGFLFAKWIRKFLKNMIPEAFLLTNTINKLCRKEIMNPCVLVNENYISYLYFPLEQYRYTKSIFNFDFSLLGNKANLNYTEFARSFPANYIQFLMLAFSQL